MQSKTTYRPLPIEGRAILLRSFSSANLRQFFTVLSKSSAGFEALQLGLLQLITNLAGKLCPGQIAADEKIKKR